MSMTKEYIKKFVEEDYKDYVIKVTCDNEHVFFHNTTHNPPIIWDWDNETFKVLHSNQEIVDQFKHPLQITTVSLEEIQFLEAYITIEEGLKFINENITDKEKIKETKLMIGKLAGCTIAPQSSRDSYDYKTPVKHLKVGETVN
jgi:hypothetical protein